MWTITEIKERGRAAFKTNYWLSVLCAILLSLLVGGTGGVSTTTTSGGAGTQQATQDLTTAVEAMTPAERLMAGTILSGTLLLIIAIAILLKIFLFNPLQVGCYGFFKENSMTVGHADLGILASGFQRYGEIFLTMLLRDLFLVLWTCLFIIPGIIKSYSYRMVPYIIRDNPELSSTEAITRSRELMDGHKLNTFVYDLSFIGWYILGICTCGLVLIFWTNPYKYNSDATLYLRLSGRV